jgi:hypothetical protein
MLNLVVKPADINYKYIHKGTGDLMLASLTPVVYTYYVTFIKGQIVAFWQHKGNVEE